MNKSKVTLLAESLAAFLFAVWFFFLDGGYWLIDLSWYYHILLVAGGALMFFVYEVLSGNYYSRKY